MKIMELFSEIYSCYYNVVAKIMNSSINNSLSKNEITEIINDNAFCESAFYILPKLLDGQWNLLKNDNAKYRSRLKNNSILPLTNLQKAWMKALLYDKRIQLFLEYEQISALTEYFKDIEPLYNATDFYYFDTYSDGDYYKYENYINYFRQILIALQKKSPILITFDTNKKLRIKGHYIPCKIEYSNKDDKFRVIVARVRYGKIISTVKINIARIINIEPSTESFTDQLSLDSYYDFNKCKEPVILEISKERNAVERCMLHFASYEKRTEYDEKTDKYLSYIYYDTQDETELLIRILSFGPVVRVIGPENFLNQIKDRVSKQTFLLI